MSGRGVGVVDAVVSAVVVEAVVVSSVVVTFSEMINLHCLSLGKYGQSIQIFKP